jgi:hypothetical protein
MCVAHSNPSHFHFLLVHARKKLDMFLGKKITTKYKFITSHVFNDGNDLLKLELMV